MIRTVGSDVDMVSGREGGRWGGTGEVISAEGEGRGRSGARRERETEGGEETAGTAKLYPARAKSRRESRREVEARSRGAKSRREVRSRGASRGAKSVALDYSVDCLTRDTPC